MPATSNLTGIPPVTDGSEMTTGFFNSRFNILQNNILSVNTATVSGALVSENTWAAFGIEVSSDSSSYIRFHDTSNLRSTYHIGSFNTNTADGLNIWDESGQTMIVSFSKQSVRFFQNVVGPVFNTSGDFVHAAVYGTASMSTESRIQAAIDDAADSDISYVFLPRHFLPYSAGSISFNSRIQMVREGGDWSRYDLQAYGAAGDGVIDDRAALHALANSAIPPEGGAIFLSGPAVYRLGSTVTVPIAVALEPGQAALVDVASGFTLAIQGPLHAPVTQSIFTGSGAVRMGTASANQISPRWFGAAGDGTTNDRGAIERTDQLAQAVGGALLFPPGAYSIATSLTLASPIEFISGAYLLPASGATVGLNGAVAAAPATKIFDLGDGGAVVPTAMDNVHVAKWGATPSASGDANAQGIQAAFNHVLSEGGVVEFLPRGVYSVSTRLDLRNDDASVRGYQRTVDGYGAMLDFGASGLTTGDLVRIGATAAGNASETAYSEFRNILIRGTESNDSIEPRHSNHASDATSTTSLTGLSVLSALKWNVRNVHIDRCWRGVRYQDSWGAVYENVHTTKCLIGHHIDEGCTYITMVKPEAVNCTWGYLIYPEVVQTAIANVVMQAPRVEDCTVGFHIDPSSSGGAEIHNIHITSPYMEDIYSDGFRVGTSFVGSSSSWSYRGSLRTGKIGAFTVDAGLFAGSGASTGYGPDRKAFSFSSTPNVASGRIVFPSALSDVEHLPPHVAFQSLARPEDLSTQALDCTFPGFGAARIASLGDLLYTVGNISSVSTPGTGLYDVGFREPYVSADGAVTIVTSRDASLYAAVDDTNTSATTVRVQLRTDAGTLTDGRFHIVVHGQLAAL